MGRLGRVPAIAMAGVLLCASGHHVPAGAEARNRAFDDVPARSKSGVRHPAYVAITYLAREIGLAEGEKPVDFSGKTRRTRYEFAVALQALLTDMQRIVDLTDQMFGVPTSSIRLMRSPGGYLPRLPERRFEDPACRKLHDPDTFRGTIGRLQALVSEFEPELLEIGADVQSIVRQLDQFRTRARTVSERLLSGLAFSDVPQGHPAYDWLLELEDKILRFHLRDTFWNRTYKGKRALTRYEFAYMTRRLAVDISWICRFDARRDGLKVAESDKLVTAISSATSVGPAGTRLFRPGDAAFRNLAEEVILKRCLDHLIGLYPLFTDEMKLLGVDDPTAQLKDLRQFRRETRRISGHLRRLNRTFEAKR